VITSTRSRSTASGSGSGIGSGIGGGTASTGVTGYPPRAKPARFQTPLPPKGSAPENPPSAIYRALYPYSADGADSPAAPAVELVGGDGPAVGGFPVDDLVYVPGVVTAEQAAALDKELTKGLKRRR